MEQRAAACLRLAVGAAGREAARLALGVEHRLPRAGGGVKAPRGTAYGHLEWAGLIERSLRAQERGYAGAEQGWVAASSIAWTRMTVLTASVCTCLSTCSSEEGSHQRTLG